MPDLAVCISAALGRKVAPADRLAIAVSGGPDSVALVLLAAAAFPGRIAALTVDHGLRPATAAETVRLAEHCAAAGIPHATLAWAGPKPAANIQAAARAARYALLADWCCAHATPLLLTAHHADDQAETLLMRLARGSGSAGLAGIRPRRDLGRGVTLLRPLLGMRRADLAAIAAASGWPLVDDPANHDPRFARTRARRLLAATPWLDMSNLAAAAAHAAEAEAALAWTTDRAWAGRATVSPGAVALDLAGLPPELVRRLVLRAIAALAPDAELRGPDLARLVARGGGTLGGVRVRGGNVWQFRKESLRRVAPEAPNPRN